MTEAVKLEERTVSEAFKLVVYPVKDVAKATAYYTLLLGTEPYYAGPHYVGFRIGDQEVGLDPASGKLGLVGPLCYRDVDDIKASIEELVAAGATLRRDVTNVGNGLLVATLSDGDGNITGLRQAPK